MYRTERNYNSNKYSRVRKFKKKKKNLPFNQNENRFPYGPPLYFNLF